MSERPTFPARTPGVPRYSPSRVQTFERCGERYRRRYVERETGTRCTLAMGIGTAVHEGAKLDNLNRIATGEPLKPYQVVEVAVEAFKAEPVEAPPFEVHLGVDRAAAAAFAYTRGARDAKPIFAEKPMVARVPLDDGTEIELSGIMDMADAEGPVDYKTGRRWTPDRVSRSGQFTGYGILYRAHEERWPATARVFSIYETASGWHTETISTGRRQGDYEGYLLRLRRVAAAEDAGVYLPAAEHETTCSAKWCEFWNDCPFVAGRRDRE